MEKCRHQEVVKWNPYNKVVQCHKCGQIFEPKKHIKEIEEIIGQAIGKGSMCWSKIPKGIFDSDNAIRITQEIAQKIERI